MYTIREIKGLDSVADIYQGPPSSYKGVSGFVFACVTPRAREVFPACMLSEPGFGLIFVSKVDYRLVLSVCDEEGLVVLPEY